MSPARRWPPRLPCFVPRLGEYLGRLEQQPMSALLAQPHLLGRALRRASTLFELEVECLDVPAAWLGDDEGPRLAIREALRALRTLGGAEVPATLIAVPSPAALAALGGRGEASARSLLQTFLRSLGELDLLAGVMFDGDDGALGRVLAHYRMAGICIRGMDHDAVTPPGALVARPLPLATLAKGIPPELTTAELMTTDGPVDPAVTPEELVEVSRAVARMQSP